MPAASIAASAAASTGSTTVAPAFARSGSAARATLGVSARRTARVPARRRGAMGESIRTRLHERRVSERLSPRIPRVGSTQAAPFVNGRTSRGAIDDPIERGRRVLTRDRVAGRTTALRLGAVRVTLQRNGVAVGGTFGRSRGAAARPCGPRGAGRGRLPRGERCRSFPLGAPRRRQRRVGLHEGGPASLARVGAACGSPCGKRRQQSWGSSSLRCPCRRDRGRRHRGIRVLAWVLVPWTGRTDRPTTGGPPEKKDGFACCSFAAKTHAEALSTIKTCTPD